MALSGEYKMDESVLVLGAEPLVLRQELKRSRALKKTTIFCATCNPCLELIPSFEMGWVQVQTGCCLNSVPIWRQETNSFARMFTG